MIELLFCGTTALSVVSYLMYIIVFPIDFAKKQRRI